MQMKPKTYPILNECIERGIIIGYNRAYKHGCNDAPTAEEIQHHIHESIMVEINEYFDFENNYE